jgi:hypothetical protein
MVRKTKLAEGVVAALGQDASDIKSFNAAAAFEKLNSAVAVGVGRGVRGRVVASLTQAAAAEAMTLEEVVSGSAAQLRTLATDPDRLKAVSSEVSGEVRAWLESLSDPERAALERNCSENGVTFAHVCLVVIDLLVHYTLVLRANPDDVLLLFYFQHATEAIRLTAGREFSVKASVLDQLTARVAFAANLGTPELMDLLAQQLTEVALHRRYGEAVAKIARAYAEARSKGGNRKNAQTQAQKAEAMRLWQERRAGKHPKLRRVHQFAAEVHRRWPGLATTKVIEGWSAAWEKDVRDGRDPDLRTDKYKRK